MVYSNLDITNKFVIPFLFTISNNSLCISNVLCLVNPQNGSWVFVNYAHQKYRLIHSKKSIWIIGFTPQKSPSQDMCVLSFVKFSQRGSGSKGSHITSLSVEISQTDSFFLNDFQVKKECRRTRGSLIRIIILQ